MQSIYNRKPSSDQNGAMGERKTQFTVSIPCYLKIINLTIFTLEKEDIHLPFNKVLTVYTKSPFSPVVFLSSYDLLKFYNFITARRSYASAVLGVNSVRLSHACFVANPKNRPVIFLYHTKGQSF